ncbi:MAG: hypothetical protein KFF72_19845 [Arthrospira sp. SH-MAG29]|nr:hypothetical protein [Arthrospira sp. SH-MAG29]MBS0018570.1 hypothetical protein [Arthrospira sp. SH-MAG29]
MIVTLIVRLYLAIAILTFAYLLQKFWRDRTTSKTQLSSWQVLILAAALWPIVLPISYLERKVNKPKIVMSEFPSYRYLGNRSYNQYLGYSDRRAS